MTSTKLSSSQKDNSRPEIFRRAVKACFLGGAMGDALGMPLEQLPEAEIRANFGIPIRTYNDPVEGAPCHVFGLKSGMYTDDTQAVRTTTKGIIKTRELTPTVIADALSGWLFDNSLGQGPRYPGVTTREAMKRYVKTRDANTCGVLSRGCGAAIRIAPVAIWLALTGTEDFDDGVVRSACVTHTDKSAIDGARLVAYLIRTGINGTIPQLGELYEMCSSELMRKAIGATQTALSSKTPAAEFALELGGGTGAHEVVPMALYHLYSSNFDFSLTLTSGLNTFHPSGLDMDSILSISGAISGLRSPSAVECSEWLRDLEDADVIAAESDGLVEACQLATLGNLESAP